MATTKEINASDALALSDERRRPIPPIPPDPPPDAAPDIHRTGPLVDDSGSDKGNSSGSSKVHVGKFIPKGDEKILFVHSLSSELNISQFFDMFGKFGKIKVIKYCDSGNFQLCKVWVEYINHKDALSAFTATTLDNIHAN